MRAAVLVFMGTSILTGALVVSSSLEGCSTGSTSNTGGDTNTTSSTAHTGGGTGTGGTGGTTTVIAATIEQITTFPEGGVGIDVAVKLTGVVAMSTKFKVSGPGSSGSCLWGVFVSSPGLTETQPNSGLMITSYGSHATTPEGGSTSYCPVPQAGQPAGDAIPDDVEPGDVLDIIGQTARYLSKSCGSADAGVANPSDVEQFQLSNVESVVKTGTAAVPTPHVLSDADVATLIDGHDSDFLAKWGGVKVRASNLTTVPQAGELTDTYGHMVMTNGLLVGDKIYYVGYLKSSDACYAGPVYPSATQALAWVDGFVYLDFCTWSIDPAHKCYDLNPPSSDCVSASSGAVDASSGTACLY